MYEMYISYKCRVREVERRRPAFQALPKQFGTHRRIEQQRSIAQDIGEAHSSTVAPGCGASTRQPFAASRARCASSDDGSPWTRKTRPGGAGAFESQRSSSLQSACAEKPDICSTVARTGTMRP